MDSLDRKFTCKECGKHCYESEVLHAPNPFDPTNILVGCPTCKQVNELLLVCDEPFCWKEATCGTPISNGGYRQTCFEHKPKASK
jgi:hypothetical protein